MDEQRWKEAERLYDEAKTVDDLEAIAYEYREWAIVYSTGFALQKFAFALRELRWSLIEFFMIDRFVAWLARKLS